MTQKDFKKTVAMEAAIHGTFALIGSLSQLRLALEGLVIKVGDTTELPTGTPIKTDAAGIIFYDTRELLRICEHAIAAQDSELIPDVLGLRQAAENIITRNKEKKRGQTLRDSEELETQVRAALDATPAQKPPHPDGLRPHRRAELAETVAVKPYQPLDNIDNE